MTDLQIFRISFRSVPPSNAEN